MTPSVDAGAASKVTEFADARRPVPTPRLGSLFAAPTMAAAARWVLGNDMCRYNTRVRELVVDADTVMVYRVRAWERVEVGDDASADAYWATGMTLTDWLASCDEQGWVADEWEVVLKPAEVLSWRNVSAKRLLAQAPQWRLPELLRAVRLWPHMP